MAVGSAAPSSKGFYQPALDSLRFFAFFSVFLVHTLPLDHRFYSSRGLPTILGDLGEAGRFGVDLFFVLSGYLITELLLRERQQTGALDVRAFYARRILRIWPLYFLALGLGVLFTKLGWEALTRHEVLGFSLLAGNWMCAFHGYPNSFIFPLWSVSIEEQFYLTWALVLRALSRRSLAVVAVAIIVVANLARALAVHHGASFDYLWCSTFTRLDPIACGILLAVALRGRTPSFSGTLRALLFLAGAAVWMLDGRFLVRYPTNGTAMMLAFPVAAVGAVALFLSALGPLGRRSWLRGNPLLVYLGKISYGLYVFHPLGIKLARAWLGATIHSSGRYAAYWLVALAATVALAALSYHSFEKPFLRLKQRFSRVTPAPAAREYSLPPAAPIVAPEAQS